MNGFRFFPQTVVWEVTFACNMRCLHCGTSAGKARPDELTTAESLAMIDELAALGCEVVNMSGGEPLLRKDWRQLAERIKQNNMILHIISNGYLIDEATVADFKRLKFDNIGVSFDGVTKTHDYIRRTPGSHDRAYKAMSLLAKEKMRFCAVSQISNLNLGEIDDIRKELIDVGCKAWRIQMTTATGRMPKDLTLTLDNYPRLIDKLLDYAKDEGVIRVDVGENIGYYGCKGTELVGGEPYLGCYAGTRVLGIESDGKLKGCLSMPEEFVEGNLRDSSLTAIWNDPDKFAYNRKFTKETAHGECHDCRFLPLCRGGCTTTSVGASGQRADNPYCIYRLEKKQGIEPTVTPLMQELLGRFKEPAESTEER